MTSLLNKAAKAALCPILSNLSRPKKMSNIVFFSVPYSCIFIVFVFIVGSGIRIYPQSRDALIRVDPGKKDETREDLHI